MKKLIMIGLIVCAILSGCGPDYIEMKITDKVETIKNGDSSYVVTFQFMQSNGNFKIKTFAVNKESYDKYKVDEILLTY